MKKNILIVVVFLFTILGFSQETEFKFTKEGFTDFVITEVRNKTQSEMYKKAIDWVSVTFKNPKEVIMAQIENDYIRIEGSSDSFICINSLFKEFQKAKYQIEISFKDGKYKFDIISIQNYIAPSQYNSGGWHEFDIINMNWYFNKKGEIKSVYKYYPEMIPQYFNKLNLELKDFLFSDKIPSKKSDW